MFEAFKIGAVVNISMRGLAGVGLAAQQFGVAGKNAAVLQARLNQIRNLAIGGAVTFGFGAAMAGGMLKAADAAGQLALNLKAVQVTGRFTNEQMATLQKTVFDVSGITARSAQDVALWMNTVESATSFTSKQLAAIMPSIAKFADIMFFSKQVPFEQSVTIGARFAHLFQMYSPAQLEEGLRMMTAVSRVMPGGPEQVMAALTQFSPIAPALHVPPAQQLAVTALLNRLGMESRGGTGLMNMIQYLMPNAAMLTSTRLKQHEQALIALGMVQPGPGGKGLMPKFMTGGALDMFAFLQGIIDSYQKATGGKSGATLTKAVTDWTSFMHQAFNIRGERVAAVIAAMPNAMSMLESIMHKINTELSVARQQAEFAKTWAYQMSVVRTNFQNIILKVFLPFVQGEGPSRLARVAQYFKQVADSITPAAANTILKIATAFAATFTMVGAILLLNAALTAFTLLAGPVGILAGALVAFTAVFLNWHVIVMGLDAVRRAILALLGIKPAPSPALPGIPKHSATVRDVMAAAAAGNWTNDPFIRNLQAQGIPLAQPGLQRGLVRAGGLGNILRMGGLLGGFWTMFFNSVMGNKLPTTQAMGGINIGTMRGGDNHFNIVIHAAPGQTPRELIDELTKRIDEKLRDAARASGAGVLHPLVPSHGY